MRFQQFLSVHTSFASISAASLALSSCSLSHSASFSARFFAARAAGCLSMFRLLSGLLFRIVCFVHIPHPYRMGAA